MKYKIPVFWQMMGIIEVDAESLEDAIEVAESVETPLPTDASYVDDSFEVDAAMAEEDYPEG